MLQERAMLAQLTIRQWTAQRFDKEVTAKVERDHAAREAGRFNKQLVRKEALEAVRKLASSARELHYKMTLPWGDNGDRLLPSKAYMDYTTELRGLTAQFERAVDDFIQGYPALVNDAQQRLGSLYKPDDYPSAFELREKFGIQVSFMPVPDAADFRVDVGDAERRRIRDEITQTVAQRQTNAIKDCWERLKEVVSKIEERLTDKDAVFRDSLIENARLLTELLPKLNITEDPSLEALRTEVQQRLLQPPQRLRDDLTLRQDTATAAREILSRLQAASV